jgi:hypothetical protein
MIPNKTPTHNTSGILKNEDTFRLIIFFLIVILNILFISNWIYSFGKVIYRMNY